MARKSHSRSVFACPEPTGGSVAGSIGLLVLLAAVVVAASYPQLALAAAVGATGAYLARRGVRALRGRQGARRLDDLAALVAPGFSRGARDDRTKSGRSVPDRRS